MQNKQIIDSWNKIKPSSAADTRMYNAILKYNRFEQSENPQGFKRSRRNRTVLVSVAAMLVLSALTVFAMTNSFSLLIERLNPPFQSVLEPIEMVSVDQGIKMEVVAAGFYDNMAMAYITWQDLEGDQINESINFENSYLFKYFYVYNGDDFCPMNVDFVDFDEATGVITYLVTALAVDAVEYDSITFSTSKIINNIRGWEDYPTGVDLKTLKSSAEAMDVPFNLFRGGSSASLMQKTDSVLILKRNEYAFSMPDNPTSRIVSVGIIDQKLHVQIWRDIADEDSFTAYYLSDGTDAWIWPEAQYLFNYDEQGRVSEEEQTSRYSEYEELIFPELPNLSDLQLLTIFNLADVIFGEWSVTVENHQAFEPLKKDIHIETGDFTYESISINPFGLTMNGTRHNRQAGLDMPEIIVHLDDGDVILECENAKYPEDTFEAIYKSEKPIDVSKIKSVTIMDNLISF